MRKTFAVGAATSGTGCPTRVGRASRSALEITLQRDDSSGKPPRRQTIDYLDQATIDYRDHSQERLRPNGWMRERQSCCPSSISTWSSRFRK